jgi:hypothetical protein
VNLLHFLLLQLYCAGVRVNFHSEKIVLMLFLWQSARGWRKNTEKHKIKLCRLAENLSSAMSGSDVLGREAERELKTRRQSTKVLRCTGQANALSLASPRTIDVGTSESEALALRWCHDHHHVMFVWTLSEEFE